MDVDLDVGFQFLQPPLSDRTGNSQASDFGAASLTPHVPWLINLPRKSPGIEILVAPFGSIRLEP